jgi:hypothetical protein
MIMVIGREEIFAFPANESPKDEQDEWPVFLAPALLIRQNSAFAE